MKKPRKDKEGNMLPLGHMTALSKDPAAEFNNQAAKHPPPQEHQKNDNFTQISSKMQLRKWSNDTGQPTMNLL